MQIISELQKMRSFSLEARKKGKRIGFVPTMGHLHRGHLSLVEAAKKTCGAVVVSIFVNPLQFGAGEDFKRYPRNLEQDKKLLSAFNIDVLFLPAASDMYPPDFSCFVEEASLSQGLCGENRPGHFRGVATVVLKLFEIVRPDCAFFGEKDFQQQVVIKKMVRDLNLDLEIMSLPTVREPDGLALSSRNHYLSQKQRKAAPILYQTLIWIKEKIAEGERDCKKLLQQAKKFAGCEPLLRLDYLEVRDPETLKPKKDLEGPILIAIAGRIGKARLIDNLVIA